LPLFSAQFGIEVRVSLPLRIHGSPLDQLDMSEQDIEEDAAFLNYEKWDSRRAANEYESTLISRLFQKNITWAVLGFIFSSLVFIVFQLSFQNLKHTSVKPQLIPSETFWPDSTLPFLIKST